MKKVAVHFPNNKTFYLSPERKTTHKYGLDFPSEIENRALFLTGNSGVGKTTLAKKICEYENLHYIGQRYIVFQNLEERISHKNLKDLFTEKFIDGHFIFTEIANKEFPRPIFAHDRKIIYPVDYSSLEINGNIILDSSVKENFIFEFRLFKPSLVKKARIKRYKQEKKSNRILHTIYRNQSKKNIQKEEYLLYQTAHKLFEQGADVYIRTSFNGTPLRFIK